MTIDQGDSHRLFSRLAGGGFAYTRLDDNVRIEGRYLRREFKQLHGRVTVYADWAGVRNPVASATMNLESLQARKAWATHCATRTKTLSVDAFDWQAAFDAFSVETIAADENGEPPIVLDDAPAVTVRDYDVLGLRVPADGASLLIATGDSLKSMILLYVLGTLAHRGIPVLLVDTEWTADRHRGRKVKLFGADRLDHLHYLRLRASLPVELDHIRRFCDEHQIAHIGVDSIGLACDGKLTDDDTAFRFYAALAKLPPALCAAHVAKSAINPDVKSDPPAFGSVYFGNLARMTWTVKKQLGTTDDVVTVGLFGQKQNDGPRVKPVSWEFTFNADRIHVRGVDVASVDGFVGRLSIAERMIGVLKRGPHTAAALADTLDAKLDSVIKAAKRGDTFTKITGQDGITRIGLTERHHLQAVK